MQLNCYFLTYDFLINNRVPVSKKLTLPRKMMNIHNNGCFFFLDWRCLFYNNSLMPEFPIKRAVFLVISVGFSSLLLFLS